MKHACAYVCMRTHALRFLWPFFSKNSLFDPKISYIFHKHFPQVNFHLIRPSTNLGYRILTSFGNKIWVVSGTKCDVYKCPSFDSWAPLSEFKRIKRIGNKIFCFNVQLRPNLCTWQTTCIHGVGCNSIELRGIHMSEFPPLLLRKRATTGSLSKNLFCQLQAKGEWLTILKSLKKKNKHVQWPQPSTKKTRCSYKLKRYIYVVSI